VFLSSVPPQIRRLSVVLVLLLVVYFVARSVLVPATFGERGHYRAAAVDSIEKLPIHYAGREACAMCHPQVAARKAASYHRGVACEVCHGPAVAHTTDPVGHKPPAPRDRAFCPSCHAYNPARPTGFPQIDPVQHNPVAPCVTCHNAHDPTPPHPPESCAACHGSIARTKAVSPHAQLACIECHTADPRHRQTPRAFLPTKPATRDFCGRCHATGAPAPANLPNARPPKVDMATHGARYVCWQCHYPHFPEGH
jgi:ribosomal protein S27AE